MPGLVDHAGVRTTVPIALIAIITRFVALLAGTNILTANAITAARRLTIR
jgi:hypothetical protein